MKRLIVIVITCLFASCLSYAQEIKVSSVRVLQNDLQARTQPRKDLNGDNCALLKVAIPVDGLLFKGSVVGEVEHTAGIYYVYVPAGTKKLEINHDKYYPVTIVFADYDVRIEQNVTYSVMLQRTDTSDAEWQFLVFEVSPKNAVVELDGTALPVSGGTAQKLVEVGSSHHYKVSMGGMVTQEGDVFVEDAEQKTVKQIILVSNSALVSVKAPVRSEIWINGEKKSSDGAWKGTLLADSYLIEARLGGKVIGSEVHNIKQSDSLQEINIKLFYGSLALVSTPPGATLDLDGTIVGETPLYLREVLPGTHLLTATKDGFYPVTKEVDVVAKQNLEVSFEMNENLELKRLIEEEAAKAEAAKREAEEKAAREAELKLKKEKKEAERREALKREAEDKAAREAEQKRLDEEAAAKAAEIKRQEEEATAAALEEQRRKQQEQEAAKAELERIKKEEAAAAKAAKKAANKSKSSIVVGLDLGLQGLKTFGGVNMTYGAMAGYAGKFGGYARFGSNFGKKFTYDGSDVKISHMVVAAGALVKVASPAYVYAGAGFSNRTLELSRSNSVYFKQPAGGVGVDAGAIIRFGTIGISAGAFVPIQVQYSEAHVGLNLFF